MSKKTEEARARLDALATEIRELADKDELTEEEEARWSVLEDEYTAAEADVQKAEQRDALEARAREVATREPVNVWAGDTSPSTEGRVRNAKRNPYDLTGVTRESKEAYAHELRTRALDAIEIAPSYVTDEQRESATRLIDLGDKRGAFSAHMLATGREDYVDAFIRYMETGVPVPEHLKSEMRGSEHESLRAAMAETSTHGTELVPYFLDPTIILTNAGALNPFRGISDVVTITTNTWHGVSSAGVTAEWIAEATEVADASPTFTTQTITTNKADAYVQASQELVQDTNIAAQLARLLADAKDRLEATAFAVGSGSGQPTGIVTALEAITASRVSAATNGSFGAIDVFTLPTKLDPRWRPNATWAANIGTQTVIRSFAAAASPYISTFWTDFNGDIPSKLLGYPIVTASGMEDVPVFALAGGTVSTATASNDDILVIGDFRAGYKIVDRVGMSVQYNPLVLGSNRRPTGEFGWVAFWRVGAGEVTGGAAFRLLRV